jgi:hypothetical protein
VTQATPRAAPASRGGAPSPDVAPALASLACLVGLGVLLAGCGTPPPASQFPSAADALARMHATYACVNGVQGDAKIDNFSPQGRIRGEMSLMVVNPDRVRFDVVSPFGVVLYSLASNGTRFQMTDVKEKVHSHGPAKACNLARLTQVPVPGHALVSLLRGEAPVLAHDPQAASISWDDGGFYRVLLSGRHDATEEIHIGVRPDDWERPWAEQRVRVLDVRVNQRGIDLYQAEMDRHQAASTAPPREDPDGIDPTIPPSGGACDAELPRSIRMRVPNTQQDVIFQYKEAKWNPPIIQGAFRLVEPGGVRKQFVDCQD